MTARHVLTILAVSELARARRFYGEAFGWAELVVAPVYVEFALPGGMRLGLYQREHFGATAGAVAALVQPPQCTGAELYLQVERLDDALACVLAAGARLLSEAAPRDWGERVAYAVDPDGNVLALAQAGG